MTTNSEIAAFENFKFNVGDVVRLIAERITAQVCLDDAVRRGINVETKPVIAMVVCRVLLQDESGISRVYRLSGLNLTHASHLEFKEFELETVVV